MGVQNGFAPNDMSLVLLHAATFQQAAVASALQVVALQLATAVMGASSAVSRPEEEKPVVSTARSSSSVFARGLSGELGKRRGLGNSCALDAAIGSRRQNGDDRDPPPSPTA